MSFYGYNYPWSGLLGRIFDCCPYCGNSGYDWLASSAPYCHGKECRKRRKAGAKPIPELVTKQEREYERLARLWCDEHNIDYDKTVQNYLNHLGPPLQERDDPIPGADKDYTVYKWYE